jgi:hypothetical protein
VTLKYHILLRLADDNAGAAVSEWGMVAWLLIRALSPCLHQLHMVEYHNMGAWNASWGLQINSSIYNKEGP